MTANIRPMSQRAWAYLPSSEALRAFLTKSLPLGIIIVLFPLHGFATIQFTFHIL